MGVQIGLDGKVAIVTGGSRGIGEAIARTFVAHGARVVIASRKLDGVAEVASSIASEHGADRIRPMAAHTGKEDDCVRLVEQTVAAFGRVDVLVNNAGTNPYFGPFINADDGAWNKTFDVNLKGYFWCAREVARHLVAAPGFGDGRNTGTGSIINVASIAGLVASPMQGVYSMTKAAVISMTKTLALELGPSKIRVNAIAPGFVDTRLASAILKNDELVKSVVARTPLGRYGMPDEIAGGALYLASDAASFLTGHTLVIDGGLTLG